MRIALVGCTILVLALVGAARAQVPGAKYLGTTSRGGHVQLEVSADGTTLTHFDVDFGLPCGRDFSAYWQGGDAITGHAFSHRDETDPNFTYDGSFSGDRAQGALSYTAIDDPSCSTTVTWTASVTHTLTVVVVGDGSVTSEQAGADLVLINCGGGYTDCSGQWAGTVTLDPYSTTAGNVNWSVAGCTGYHACKVALSGDKTVTVTFTKGSSRESGSVSVTFTKHPPKRAAARTATFAFTANVPGTRFTCGLDMAPQKSCTSPRTYTRLRPGPHIFSVRAFRPGSSTPWPFDYTWTVVR